MLFWTPIKSNHKAAKSRSSLDLIESLDFECTDPNCGACTETNPLVPCQTVMNNKPKRRYIRQNTSLFVDIATGKIIDTKKGEQEYQRQLRALMDPISPPFLSL